MENDLNNRAIQSLWIGNELSKVEQLCVKSFLDNGHDFHLYVYDEIKNIPKGARIFDANQIIGKEAIFRNGDGWAKGSVSGFADLFRMMLIQKNGGWWVDMDVICLKNIDLQAQQIFCSSYEYEYGALPNNCVFKASKKSEFLSFCLEQLNNIDLKTMDFGFAGPFLFQRAIKELGLEKDVVPYYYFNPITWKNLNEIALGNMLFKNRLKEIVRPIFKPATLYGRSVNKKSYTIHLWNEIWAANKLDKNGKYNANCIFEKLKRKHGII